MKTNMRLMLLVWAAFAAASSISADVAKAGRVYVDMRKIVDSSSAGQSLVQWSQQKNAELNELLSSKQNELQNEEKALSALRSSEGDFNQQAVVFECKQKQARLDVENKKSTLEAEFSQKARSIQANVKEVIGKVADKEGWLEVCNKEDATALYFSSKLDVTEKVLAEFNRAEKAKVADSLLRDPNGAKTADILKA